jgi:hypothetical protein
MNEGHNKKTFFHSKRYNEKKLSNNVPHHIFESIDDSIISFQKKIHRPDPRGLDSFFYDSCECYKCEKL